MIFRGGEGALQILPPLLGVVAEARLNLAIYHLKQGMVHSLCQPMSHCIPCVNPCLTPFPCLTAFPVSTHVSLHSLCQPMSHCIPCVNPCLTPFPCLTAFPVSTHVSLYSLCPSLYSLCLTAFPVLTRVSLHSLCQPVSGNTEEAHQLIKDLEPSSPQEYILKAVCNAYIGQEQGSVRTHV